MSSKKKSNIKITPKKKGLPSGGRNPPSRKQPTGPKGGPPSRSQPAGPKGNAKSKKSAPAGGGGADSVVARLQQLITQKDDKIEKLTERINTLSMENKSLQSKIERLNKSSAGPPKKKAAGGGGGVSSGPGQGGAAAMLAAKLGGHVKSKKLAEKKVDKGGVETGPGMKGAAAALGGLFAKKKAPPKKDAGGISGGMSQKGAAAALGGLFAKKKAPPKSSGGGGGGGGKKSSGKKGDFSQYNTLFKKYEMMMKLGINVHGAVGRMRQDGCEKDAIAAFEKKHNAYGEEEEKVDPASLGLKIKKEVPVSKGIKMKRLHWDPTNLKHIKGSIW
eukprot:CAMPEP_0201591968 /NCGR_PEP_ID=MMETSP0190_2-20130828/189991_1 /ASSEMBLY_ACC=CAM_ASM_000263 /TAXON_ID=37353 /ORGANISM="Rosalina sp." /LENGTH=330 /DNA_ID=CAMNT_0048050523 /DNA_START=189 /DNA_END=1178 /DNA_ORIENTATION=+